MTNNTSGSLLTTAERKSERGSDPFSNVGLVFGFGTPPARAEFCCISWTKSFDAVVVSASGWPAAVAFASQSAALPSCAKSFS